MEAFESWQKPSLIERTASDVIYQQISQALFINEMLAAQSSHLSYLAFLAKDTLYVFLLVVNFLVGLVYLLRNRGQRIYYILQDGLFFYVFFKELLVIWAKQYLHLMLVFELLHILER